MVRLDRHQPDRAAIAALRLPAIAAGLTLLLHAVGNPHYGFFRDELYFIVCGRHPAWGYVDQPPLVPLLAAASQAFGISLVALRLVAALCAAASVFVACRLVRELGGGNFAQILAAICVALSPILAGFGVALGPDAIGLWAWPLAALYVARLVRGADPRWWLGVGAALGVAGEAKYSVLFFGIALLAGIALSPQRGILRTPWTLAGAFVAIAIVAPNVAWQAAHGFPMIELLRAGQNGKNVALTPVAFLVQQTIITGPLLTLVWIAGTAYAFAVPALRWIGWTFVLLLALMIAMHAKNYYPADVYPLLFATGAIAIERWTAGRAPARVGIAALAAVSSLVLLPFAMPVLPADAFVAYAGALHLGPGTASSEHHKQGRLPQEYADMHGWPELAATVASVYRSLPAADRAKAAIVASNYGEAAAIDVFGAADGLPPALSGHNQYWLWGPRGYSGDVLIDVNGDCGRSEHLFRSARRAAVFADPLGMPYEDGLPIMLCRGIAKPLSALWPAVKDYN